MEKVYIVEAYYAHEGTEPILAFSTEQEAVAFAQKANAYHSLEPKWDGTKDYLPRHKAWQAGHPDQKKNFCTSYEVSEVEFVQPNYRSES